MLFLININSMGRFKFYQGRGRKSRISGLHYQTYPGIRANVRTTSKIRLQINLRSQVYLVSIKSLCLSLLTIMKTVSL